MHRFGWGNGGGWGGGWGGGGDLSGWTAFEGDWGGEPISWRWGRTSRWDWDDDDDDWY
jgi:hypothetical protein